MRISNDLYMSDEAFRIYGYEHQAFIYGGKLVSIKMPVGSVAIPALAKWY